MRNHQLDTHASLLASLLLATPQGIAIVNLEGCFLYLDPDLESLVGRNMLGKPYWKGCMDDHLQSPDCPLRQLIKPGSTRTFETSGMLGGRTFRISHTGMLSQGESVIVQLYQDITDRNQTSRVLDENNEYYWNLAESAFDGIIVHEFGKVREANRTAAKVFGTTREDMIGEPVLSFIHPASRPATEAKISSSFERPFETVGIASGGNPIHLYVHDRSISFHGETLRVAALRDITQLKRYQEQIVYLEKDRAAKMWSVRTPLTSEADPSLLTPHFCLS